MSAASSGEERKIPKIVLKFGLNQKPAEALSNESIFSAKAETIIREHHDVLRQIPAIPFILLVKKTNQSVYRAFENFLELSGRMSDMERKKALFQILTRVKLYFRKLHLLSEWTKIHSTHMLVKLMIVKAHEVQNRLKHLDHILKLSSDHRQALVLPPPGFELIKELNVIQNKCPLFFASPILNLSAELAGNKVVGSESDWTSSLEALLCLEVSKYLPSMSDIQLISIEKSKCVIQVSSIFVIELTIVPFECQPSWFVLKVEGSAEYRSVFRNGLTGIFQARYNNKLCSEFNIFSAAVQDCSTNTSPSGLFSEFSYLSSHFGRQNLAFYHDNKAKSFQIKPWFMKSTLSIGFSHTNGFEVGDDFKSLFLPKLSFGTSDASEILEKLFDLEYGSKLRLLIAKLNDIDLINGFEAYSVSCFKLLVLNHFQIILSLNAMEKQIDVKFANFPLDKTPIAEQIKTALLEFDQGRLAAVFAVICCQVSKQLLSEYSEFRVVECIGVSDMNTVVISKPGLGTTMKTFKGILSFEFKEDSSQTTTSAIPQDCQQLLAMFESFFQRLYEQTNQTRLFDAISTLKLKGDFVDDFTFSVYSQGFPSIVKSAVLKESSPGLLSLSVSTVNETFVFNVLPESIMNLLASTTKILWIHDHSTQLGISSVVDANLNLNIKTEKNCLLLSLGDRFDIIADGPAKNELEEILNATSFNIYDFFERLG